MDTNFKLILSQSRLDSKDAKITPTTLSSVGVNYGSPTSPIDRVQLHVYDLDGNHVVSANDLRYTPTGSYYRFERVNGETILYTDPVENLRNLGLHSGTYRSVYNFFRYYLTAGPKLVVAPWYIQDISTSRRELRVATTTKNFVGKTLNSSSLELTKNFISEQLLTATYVLDFGNNNIEVVINQMVSGENLLFKLYKPLPDDIEEKTSVVPYVELARPIEIVATLVNELDVEKPVRELQGRNTNIFVGGLYEVGTAYQSWNDLLSTNPQTSKDLLDQFLSSSNHTETINVNYSDYTNFVHFSSAEERVRNFQYKLQLLEQYDSTIGTLRLSNASGSSFSSQSVNFYNNLKRNVLNGFDGYENWLYWESGSTYSSSLGWGEVTQSTWPKSTTAYPYRLYSVTSSQGTSWFNNEVLVANTYDRNNTHNLLATAPFHIREDEEHNDSYLTFLQMMGQHYDTLWTYTKHMTQRYAVEHKLNEGAAKDVIWDTMRSFGLDLTNGNDVTSLWKYAFGTDVTGSYGNNIYKMSYKDSSREIWKRLFNNLSYLLKTKGTVRGIKALITCYGIPSTMLRVKEYGGPDPDLSFESSKYISDEFTYQLNFDGTQIVSQSWFNPNGVEFRFYADPNNRTSMTLFEADKIGSTNTNIRLSVVPSYNAASSTQYTSLYADAKLLTIDGRMSAAVTSSGQYVTASGYVLFEASGNALQTQYAITNELPVYNKQYWSLLLQRAAVTSSNAYTLWVKQQSDGRITFAASFSITLSGSAVTNSWDASTEFQIGASKLGRNPFIGTMQEFRLWTKPLNEDVFNNHVLAPLAYNGNTYSSSYYDLALRWRMNQSEWYVNGGYNTLLLDSNPGQGVTRHGVWSGSNSASVFATLQETNYYESPGIGLRRMASNKVRVDTYVSQSGQLSPTRRVTLSRFDSSPLDSNKVGIFLSPTEMINEDIIRTFAGQDFDNFIGNPLDATKRYYPDLDAANTWYWSKYGTNPNIYTYLRVLSYFDKSLYNNIRKLLPARVVGTVGFLFEQHMLERSRNVIVTNVTPSTANYTTSIDVDGIRNLVSDTKILMGSTRWNIVTPTSDTEMFNASQSLIAISDTNPYSYNILDMSVVNGVLTMNSGSYFVWSATGSIVLPVCDFWLDPMSKDPVTGSNGAVIGYSGSHYIFHRQRFTGLENLWYDGCLQTVFTTTDKGLPFETFEAPPNILTVVDASTDKPRLKVE